MHSNAKLACAIAAIVGGSPVGASYGANVADTADAEGIQEITVTAQRRDESIQNVPITVQALTGDQLSQLNVQTFTDLVKYTPNVTFAGPGPGGGNIYIRGLATTNGGNQNSASFSPFPNVALYLDDQSMTFPGRNVDVYMVDIERVEVLEGPQGTLFGGGAEAGAVRYITNKPKLNVTEGNTQATYGTTAGGGDNSSANATINLPLITDTLAVRATIYDDHRGGYITNVPSSFNSSAPTAPAVNNNNLVGSQTNPVNYTGLRASLLYQINDDWNLLVTQSYQNMQADGYFEQYPIGSAGQILGPDQITAFQPAYDKDKYENSAWTINGKIDEWKLVYTGSYLDRHIEQQGDYTNYLRSPAGTYYSCTGASPAGLGVGTQYSSSQALSCYAPNNATWHDSVQNSHQSQEIRVSSPEDNTVRGIVGAYWEKFAIEDQMDWNYINIPNCNTANLAIADAGGPACVSSVGPLPGTPAVDPGLRPPSEAFGEDVQRGYTQTAFFASVDVDLIPKILTFTAGTRHYHYNEYETGSEFYTSTSCVDVPNGTCSGVSINGHASYSGFKSRGNLTWHITSDIMAYATWSQGFRPGAFNPGPGATANFSATAPGLPQYEKPASYGPDSLTNKEIGLKSEFFNHRLQVNLSGYIMDWNNVQMLFFNPVALGNNTFGVNGPAYHIKGAELQVVARVTDGLTVQGSSSWNSVNQTTSPCLVSNIPTSPTYGQCITSVKGAVFENPFGALDTRPAFSPPLEFNLRARYDIDFNNYKTFAWAGASHIAHMSNEPATYQNGNAPGETIPTTALLLYDQPGYTTYDAAIGIGKDNWTVQATGNNLFNSNASTYTTSSPYIKAEVPLRPRVLTLQIGYRF